MDLSRQESSAITLLVTPHSTIIRRNGESEIIMDGPPFHSRGLSECRIG